MMNQTIVIKIGTSSLTDNETGQLSLSTIAALVEVLTRLRAAGHRVVLVSSGGRVGCRRLGIQERPKKSPSNKRSPPLVKVV
jgi:glutamate 5-kinase